MKRYLLQLPLSEWRELTTLTDQLNRERKKLKQPYLHRAELIRLAISHLCSLPAEQFNSVYSSNQLSNDRESN